MHIPVLLRDNAAAFGTRDQPEEQSGRRLAGHYQRNLDKGWQITVITGMMCWFAVGPADANPTNNARHNADA
jgi:hypothetical protein